MGLANTRRGVFGTEDLPFNRSTIGGDKVSLATIPHRLLRLATLHVFVGNFFGNLRRSAIDGNHDYEPNHTSDCAVHQRRNGKSNAPPLVPPDSGWLSMAACPSNHGREEFVASTWKSMQAAPKDGTRVLLLARAAMHGSEQSAPVVGHWSRHRDAWVDAIIESGTNRSGVELQPVGWIEIPPSE